jgi:hypothetical protein
MNKKFLPLFSVAALLATASVGHAALIVGFNFNNATSASGFGTFNTVGTDEVFDSGTEVITPATHGEFKASSSVNLSALVGTQGGTINNNWGAGVGATENAVSGDPGGFSLGVAGVANNAAYVTFATETTGRTDVVLTYGTRSTRANTDHTWSYSTDGVTFTNVTTVTSANAAFATQTIDMSAISAVENQAVVYFRLTFSNFTLTSQATYIDNVQIIPEPGAALLGGLGLLALLRRRR